MRATFDGAGAQLAAELYGLCYTIEPRGIKRGDDERHLQRHATCERRGVYVCYVLISRQSTRAQGACTVHGVQGPAGGSDFFSLSPSRFRTCIRRA